MAGNLIVTDKEASAQQLEICTTGSKGNNILNWSTKIESDKNSRGRLPLATFCEELMRLVDKTHPGVVAQWHSPGLGLSGYQGSNPTTARN
jgi:hypothetical protein